SWREVPENGAGRLESLRDRRSVAKRPHPTQGRHRVAQYPRRRLGISESAAGIAAGLVVGLFADDVEAAVELNVRLTAIGAGHLYLVVALLVADLGAGDLAAAGRLQSSSTCLLQRRAGYRLGVVAAGGGRNAGAAARDRQNCGPDDQEFDVLSHLALLWLSIEWSLAEANEMAVKGLGGCQAVGISIQTSAPPRFSSPARPPWARAIVSTIARPSPAPPWVRATSARVNRSKARATNSSGK